MTSKLSIPTAPARQVRASSLNTIIEDGREWEENARIRNAQDIADAGPPMFNPSWGFGSERTKSRIKEISPISEASSCSGLGWSRRNTSTDFDDLYDATEDEMSDSCQSACSQGDSVGSRESRISNGSSRNKYPSLPIPHDRHRFDVTPRTKDSPVPPTPPPKIPLSPEVLSRLSRSVPALHAPPSLDGSGASDQHSNISTPQTPDIGSLPGVDWSDEQLHVHTDVDQNRDSNPPSARMSPQIDIELESPEDWSHVIGNFPLAPGRQGSGDASPVIPIVDTGQPWSANGSNRGVQLPAPALATLKGFEPGDDFALASAVSDANDGGEMKEVPVYTHRRRSTSAVHPVSASSNDFTPLSVPSPGGFFSSLKGEARHTWCLPSANPPSSSTAENFYNCPWNIGGKPSERLSDLESETNTGDSSTAKATSSNASSISKASGHLSLDSDRTITAPTKTLENSGTPTPRRKSFFNNEYDEFYEEELKYQASINIDRTGSWLAAQSAYLAALRESNPVNKVDCSPATISVESMQTSGSVSKKSIGGLTTIHEEGAVPQSPPMKNRDAMFYRNFQRIARKSRSQDIFLHSNFRFEAVQANRLSLTEKHVDQLVGRYTMTTPERPPYRGPFSQAPRNSTIPEILKDQAKFMKLEKEKDIINQLHTSMWAVEALKYLNGGRLIPSPASKRLAKATAPLGTIESAGSHRTRALDLGGNASCGWAWYLSHEYKNVKIYTVLTKQQIINPELKGPSNHRQVSVPHLWRLPFRDNQFDVISARTFHSMLKRERPLGESTDEFDLCLKECFRCLKPGGYLEFFVMDSEIVQAGPYGSAVSVEFGFNLKTRGYDPMPTKSFLCRLRKAKFVDIKRAWMFLPIGAMQCDSQLPGGGANGQDEAKGSTTDIASTTGLLGGWMWEQWLVKLQMEMGRDREKLLEEIAPVFTEGGYGAGWRCLSGWAMKPMPKPHALPP